MIQLISKKELMNLLSSQTEPTEGISECLDVVRESSSSEFKIGTNASSKRLLKVMRIKLKIAAKPGGKYKVEGGDVFCHG